MVTPKVIDKVSNLVTENKRISYYQSKETSAISAPSVHKILHEHLKVRKVCTFWVPHLLTVKQMACRVVWCKEMLKDYANGALLGNIITMSHQRVRISEKRRQQRWLDSRRIFVAVPEWIPHTARLTQEFFKNVGLKLLAHPPYSPDLAPCDFGLFPLVKDKLKGHKFRTDATKNF
ncbi:hypothetical protein ILUMI_20125 [Ignelater luminosus]|uniref:Transposase n=1 Tax=Ignelater luminosus TaxID=2038154 RepID=A0A8K0CJ30_IGNLU|nr:hypothetical protein ILUMI_20125 [Ignelater luminosus]